MTLSQTIATTCEDCGTKATLQGYAIIDAVKDPQLKAEVLAAKLWVSVCAHCKEEIWVEYPFFYVDSSKQLMLKLVFDKTDEAELESVWSAYSRALPPDFDQYRTREVRCHAELTEKIRIFDDGLDDYAIELFKAAARRLQADAEEVRYAKLDKKKGEILLAVRVKDGRSAYAVLPLAIHGGLVEQLRASGACDGERAWARVDEEFGDKLAETLEDALAVN